MLTILCDFEKYISKGLYSWYERFDIQNVSIFFFPSSNVTLRKCLLLPMLGQDESWEAKSGTNNQQKEASNARLGDYFFWKWFFVTYYIASLVAQ